MSSSRFVWDLHLRGPSPSVLVLPSGHVKQTNPNSSQPAEFTTIRQRQGQDYQSSAPSLMSSGLCQQEMSMRMRGGEGRMPCQETIQLVCPSDYSDACWKVLVVCH
ncbi:hypothetical protein TNCV_5112291 [Trichonephila clavipes]|nr:hypothetical protein TNCV_5112291 [Trichonephila clavipes]